MQFFKRLELQGFKSFANKTVVEFLPGVTVIVGPNGSGKSNIFDAIRWVLGEQSAKSLRGTRMGDVIFNGSASLKATGLAKVELVLDNSRRHLPIDFDEVSIARHLYRTGESEYLLNRTACRLKDIATLLMDTGIGTDSYSVLEQGRVDAIINSRPLERRMLFDEAAGISKYKTKKEEALAKLQRTEESLVRLADIIAEVRRQINSLKRQAAKAERYKRLTAELDLLEKELLARQYRALLEEVAGVEANYTTLEQRVTGLRQQMAQLEEKQEAVRRKSEEIHAEFEQVRVESFAVGTQLAQTQSQIELLEQRDADAQSRASTLEREMQALRERLNQIQEQLAQLQRERDDHRAVVAQLEEDYRVRKAEHDALKSQCDAASVEAMELRRKITELQGRKATLESQRQVAHAMEAKLRNELEQCEADERALAQQMEALAIEREERQAAMEDALQLLEALKADLGAKRDELAVAENELQKLRGELFELQRREQVCRSRHDALVELQENFEGYYGGVREVMLRAKAGELRGIVGAVSTLLEALDEHELAIEVALGSQAQDIVVETAEHAKTAIEWLKKSGRGRATFLPLDLIEAREQPPRWSEMRGRAGVIGLASELVRYDARLERAVSYLLGGVVVCRDLDTAVELKRQGFRARFVTLEGELVVPQGAMTGGSVKSQGLLHRTREIRKLGEELENIRQREKLAAQQAENVAQRLKQLREVHDKLVRSANQQEIEAAHATKDFEIAEQKFAEKAKDVEALARRRTEIETEIAKHRHSQELALGELTQITEMTRDTEERLSAIETQTSSQQQELAAHGRELNDLVVRMSTARERLHACEDKIAGLESERLRVMAEETSRRTQLDDLREQQQQAQVRIEDLRKQVNELQQRQRALDERLTHESSRKETIALDLSKLGERVHELRRDLHEADNAFHEEELRRAHLTERLRLFEQQAQEKFHLTPAELLEQLDQQWQRTAEENRKPSIEDLEEEGNGSAWDVTEMPVAPTSLEEIGQRIATLREKIENLGPVHIGAIDEYNALVGRYEFLTREEKDLQTAKAHLTEVIRSIDHTTTQMFLDAFEQIRQNFQEMFRRLFGGGRADLLLTEENGVLDCGIDIMAQPPGKKPTHISLLSGGEKALTAIALLFGIFMRKPSPVCILDEIDAPLDDKNIERFKQLVREFSDDTQFIIITHNKQTMALANTIYGVTMEEEGVSRLVSLRLDEFDDSEFAREAVIA
ncbi:MAG: chromosome segregation protein SMC [Candidatus Sumerlaeaceae bacterium]